MFLNKQDKNLFNKKFKTYIKIKIIYSNDSLHVDN